MRMKEKSKKYIVEKLIQDDTVKPKESDQLSGPSPDEGLIYRNFDLCWYPNRNLKDNKTEHDKLSSIL